MSCHILFFQLIAIFRELIKQYRRHSDYRKAIKNIKQRFPQATTEDLKNNGLYISNYNLVKVMYSIANILLLQKIAVLYAGMRCHLLANYPVVIYIIHLAFEPGSNGKRLVPLAGLLLTSPLQFFFSHLTPNTEHIIDTVVLFSC